MVVHLERNPAEFAPTNDLERLLYWFPVALQRQRVCENKNLRGAFLETATKNKKEEH